MPLRRSARIHVRGTAVMTDDHSSVDAAAAALINEPDKRVYVGVQRMVV